MQRIEDYALIGNGRTAALVGRDGSIDWMCVPRFDSPACFAALLGTPEHGRWLIAPVDKVRNVRRRYRGDTLVLDTRFETARGVVRLTDCMPMLREGITDVVRIVEGVRGRVRLRMELVIRLQYGTVVPWVRRIDGEWLATGGPLSLALRSGVDTYGENFRTVAEFTIGPGERVPFVITVFASNEPTPLAIDAGAAVETAVRQWSGWCEGCRYDGRWRDAVMRSLLTVKALIHEPTGGMVAAPTTSLPEALGGARNWDYRFCWVRDSTFTLYALLLAGRRDEAVEWQAWLLRSAAGRPEDLQVLYGVAGERIRGEVELDWLPGYENSVPVRVGNAAAHQFQLDVYGELIETLTLARGADLAMARDAWNFQRKLLEYLETSWREPDRGIWEVRGPARHFTHSKVMAWAAFDRSIAAAEKHGLRAPLARWRCVRDRIHAEVCANAYDPQRNTFVQYYGATQVDASLLLLPIVGFLSPRDRRIRGTVDAIERELSVDGLIARYRTEPAVDGLEPGEAMFLPCSFWFADALALMGRQDEAVALFERLLKLGNDVGLLAEEYDPITKRQLGNFPQALTHVAVINTARNLSRTGGPSEHRSGGMRAHPPEGRAVRRSGHPEHRSRGSRASTPLRRRQR